VLIIRSIDFSDFWIKILFSSLLLISIHASSEIKSDEIVTFFPTIGYPNAHKTEWTLQIHGWIYEPEWSGDLREFTHFLGLNNGDTFAEDKLFQERKRAFFVDNQRGKKISIQLGNKLYPLDPSTENGHFYGILHLSTHEVMQLRANQTEKNRLSFTAITRPKDTRIFKGEVQLLEEQGISVISDIDDTVKISNVRDKKALLANTFTHPFQAVEGMATLYQAWSQQGAEFHYVSASPWQLYPALADFLAQSHFPLGSFHLRSFRWKDGDFFNLFKSSQPHKLESIQSLIQTGPHRRFILVGDSGEQDPEIYANIARNHPQAIVKILIREASSESESRYQTAFKDLPTSLWQVFKNTVKVEPDLAKLIRISEP